MSYKELPDVRQMSTCFRAPVLVNGKDFQNNLDNFMFFEYTELWHLNITMINVAN